MREMFLFIARLFWFLALLVMVMSIVDRWNLDAEKWTIIALCLQNVGFLFLGAYLIHGRAQKNLDPPTHQKTV